MPRKTILAGLQKDATVGSNLQSLDGVEAAGRPLKITIHPYAAPYLEHIVDGFVDGPPTSVVVAVLSGRSPDEEAWRRLTLSRKGAWHYELEVFPTAFGNATAPLAPGIPPGPTRGSHH